MLPEMITMLIYDDKVGGGQMVQPTAGQDGGLVMNLKHMRILSDLLRRVKTESGVEQIILYLLLTLSTMDNTGTYVKWVCLVVFYFSRRVVNLQHIRMLL